MPKKEKLDCRDCGVCCISVFDQTSFCNVEVDDLERMGVRLVRKHVEFPAPIDMLASLLDSRPAPPAIKTKWRKVRTGPLKDCDVCACVFLRGSPLHRVSCRIYPKRPAVCRKAVKPNTRICHRIRKLFLDTMERL